MTDEEIEELSEEMHEVFSVARESLESDLEDDEE